MRLTREGGFWRSGGKESGGGTLIHSLDKHSGLIIGYFLV